MSMTLDSKATVLVRQNVYATDGTTQISDTGPIPVTLEQLAAATATTSQMPAQADSTATDVAGLVTDFNALLLKLRNAGYLAT